MGGYGAEAGAVLTGGQPQGDLELLRRQELGFAVHVSDGFGQFTARSHDLDEARLDGHGDYTYTYGQAGRQKRVHG